MAILTTSHGNSKIISPFKLNIKTMVAKRAIKVMGDIKGINFLLYQLIPLNLTKYFLDKNPAAKGIPR